MTKMKYTVQQPEPPAKPVEKTVLAEAIVKISKGFDELKASGLNEQAIVVLLNYETGVGMREIEKLFDGLRQLRGRYCR